jgi:nitrilase
LVKRGAEIIFLPSNFRLRTGQIAWDVLTKARAIENQVYFCACDQTGGIGVLERCGNSRIISYDGKIISEIGFEEGIVTADLDLNSLRQFRKEFPVLMQVK